MADSSPSGDSLDAEAVAKIVAENQAGESSSGGGDDGDQKKKKSSLKVQLPQTLHLLYVASKLRIFKLADRIAANEISKEVKLCDVEKQLEIPEQECWDFRLGDRVRIKKKYSLQDFKSIQSQTLGWNARFRTIYGCLGIVASRWSKYQNGVTIDVPSRLWQDTIYAGLLEKIPDDDIEEDTSYKTQWKVNEYVTTIMDEKLVQLMQRRLDTIPERYLGRKGRIIAVTRVAIIVTFNERTSFDINSYLLMRCRDQSPPELKERTHDKFKLGDKVKVLSNIKQLVKNQKDHGGWSESMTAMAGKEVTVIHICKNSEMIRVQYNLGQNWVVNQASLSHEPTKEAPQSDCEFRKGDIVKIKMTNDMRFLLAENHVPMIFLDYLRATAKVKLVEDDFDYMITYNGDDVVSAYASAIRGATLEEREHHMQVSKDVKDIKVNYEVFLDIGPPQYVESVLRESGESLSDDVIYALTHSSTLVGYAEDNRAVLEYSNGKRYQIKKKFLTVPKKFNMKASIDGIGLEAATEILVAIANCVQMLRSDEEPDVAKDAPVRILFMSFDTAPVVHLRVISTIVSVDRISELLLTVYEWDVHTTVAEDNVIYVKNLKSFDGEIKVIIYFNQEPYLTSAHIPVRQEHVSTHPCKTQEELPGIAQHAAFDAASGVQSPNHFKEGSMIRPQNLSDFDYIPLLHGAGEIRAYIPLYISRRGGGQRVHDEDGNSQTRPRDDSQFINYTFNIKHITNLNA